MLEEVEVWGFSSLDHEEASFLGPLAETGVDGDVLCGGCVGFWSILSMCGEEGKRGDTEAKARLDGDGRGERSRQMVEELGSALVEGTGIDGDGLVGPVGQVFLLQHLCEHL